MEREGRGRKEEVGEAGRLAGGAGRGGSRARLRRVAPNHRLPAGRHPDASEAAAAFTLPHRDPELDPGPDRDPDPDPDPEPDPDPDPEPDPNPDPHPTHTRTGPRPGARP